MSRVWILRPDVRKEIGPTRMPVRILRLTSEGEESEFESFTLETDSDAGAIEREGLFKKLIYGEIDKGRRSLVVDLHTLEKPRSPDIGEIIAALHHIRKQGGELALADLTIRALDVFIICRLDKVIPIFGSVPEAVDYLENRSQVPVEHQEPT